MNVPASTPMSDPTERRTDWKSSEWERNTMPDLPDDNPKTRFGVAKPPLHLIPSTALAHESCAFRDGAAKYGPYNWRIDRVSASTYVAAAKRHIESWFNREEQAQDSGVHHLAHARACLAILIDAQECRMLNDDRPPAVDLQGVFDRLTLEVAK